MMDAQFSHRRANPGRESGFTMPEIIAATGIIAGVVVAFTVFIMFILGHQAESRMNLIATRVAADQMESLNGIRWDDLMVGGAGVGECDLTATGEPRRSTAAVRVGPEKVTVDGVDLAVTRNVQWGSTGGDQVVCANGAGDGLKMVTVNVSYYAGQDLRTKTLVEARSRFAEDG